MKIAIIFGIVNIKFISYFSMSFIFSLRLKLFPFHSNICRSRVYAFTKHELQFWYYLRDMKIPVKLSWSGSFDMTLEILLLNKQLVRGHCLWTCFIGDLSTSSSTLSRSCTRVQINMAARQVNWKFQTRELQWEE